MAGYIHKLIGLTLLASITGVAQASDPSALDELASCQVDATLISNIQGVGHGSNMVGNKVIVKALVSAVMPKLGGYFLQQATNTWDDSDKTSEGIFVADKLGQPKVGSLVVVEAKVAEVKQLTQLEKVTRIQVCSNGHAVPAVSLALPLSDKNQLEAYEGMLVKFAQTLTISENYNYTRFGQLLLSNGRLFQPTNLARPGPNADKIAATNRLNRIVLDDGSGAKDPQQDFDINHPYRVGNTVDKVEGVVHYSFGQYMIEPTVKAKFNHSNARQAKPQIKHQGNLRVASFNVLNYFNGKGAKKAFPTDRGASSALEFERQTRKIVAAMKTIEADIFGLMEMENDGYGKDSAIAELTEHLNDATGRHYRFVKPQTDRLGDDSIAVGMIYNADTVDAIGLAATLSETPFNAKSRQPLAQTFKAKKSGQSFTLVVNHFKSKGSCPKGKDKNNPNANQGDGQACWNLVRTESSKRLVKWLNTQPTGSIDKDLLIIGDLNANAYEDPIIALQQAGFANMIARHQGKKAYSFVFRGLSGYLDHALASKSMAAQVIDATEWHINADEMRATDYNLENKPTKQQQQLFKPNAFRSSDHDPVIIELSLH